MCAGMREKEGEGDKQTDRDRGMREFGREAQKEGEAGVRLPSLTPVVSLGLGD